MIFFGMCALVLSNFTAFLTKHALPGRGGSPKRQRRRVYRGLQGLRWNAAVSCTSTWASHVVSWRRVPDALHPTGARSQGSSCLFCCGRQHRRNVRAAFQTFHRRVSSIYLKTILHSEKFFFITATQLKELCGDRICSPATQDITLSTARKCLRWDMHSTSAVRFQNVYSTTINIWLTLVSGSVYLENYDHQQHFFLWWKRNDNKKKRIPFLTKSSDKLCLHFC